VAGAVFLDVFFAAAGALAALGALPAVDDAGAFPAVEAGLGGMEIELLGLVGQRMVVGVKNNLAGLFRNRPWHFDAVSYKRDIVC
jgi:hypothetical protein